MAGGDGEPFRLRDEAAGFDRIHRWAALIALASPVAGLRILAATLWPL